MRIDAKCKCGAEFHTRTLWGVLSARAMNGYTSWQAIHSTVCMGVTSLEADDDGVLNVEATATGGGAMQEAARAATRGAAPQ